MQPRQGPPSLDSRKQPNFRDTIKFGEALTIEQAIEKLRAFHGATRENVLNAFFNLNKFHEGGKSTVVFDESKNSGNSCVIMRFIDESGKEVANDLIYEFTGQPMEHVS